MSTPPLQFQQATNALEQPPRNDTDFSILFVGGGNMSSALIGGLLNTGFPAQLLTVIDPHPPALAQHQARGLTALTQFVAGSQAPDLVIWAVKPQVFHQACQPLIPHTLSSLHLSVAAGLTTETLSRWLQTQRLVRAMPNTPALIGQGQTGLFATAAVTNLDRHRVQQVMAAVGDSLWLPHEADLDAVTAVSGSGPAYVFYFMEAMMDAAQRMGLSEPAGRQLVLGTFAGAAALALKSTDTPEVLRERVTSKGGTTFAALEHMRAHAIAEHLSNALLAAQKRAQELGRELAQTSNSH